MLINDCIDIRAKNTKSILNSLRFQPMMTKKKIADITALSFATVSNLSNELKAMNILEDSKIDEKRVGRSPSALALTQTQYLIIALDLQLENTLGFAILNLQNNIIEENTYDISDLKSAEEIVVRAKTIFDEFLAAYPVKDVRFIGIGAAVPAVFDSNDSRLVLSAVPIYEKSPLKDLLSETFSIPAYVDNIANICALSLSARYPEQKNILCMDISQGVGVGIISDGNLLRGKNGYATEVAHVPIGDSSLKCPYCGGYGCVETELSLTGMMRYFPEIQESLPFQERWTQFKEHMSTDTETAERLTRRLGFLSGRLATILINLFDPEIFYVSGYVVDIFERLEPYFQEEIKIRCEMALRRGLKITVGQDSMSDKHVYIGVSDALYDMWFPLV